MSNIDTIAYGKAGRMFTASNVSAKIITVVGTAMTGLVLYNPVGSGKYMPLMSAGFQLSTALGSIVSIAVAISPVTSVVPASLTVGSAVVRSASGGAGNSVASVWDAATLGVACVAQRWFAGLNWITGGAGQAPYQFDSKIDGELGLMPGAAACFAGIGGTLATGMGSISFIEVDL
jgi:hypothetical protein